MTDEAVERNWLPYMVKAGLMLLFSLTDVMLSGTADYNDIPGRGLWYPMTLMGAQGLLQILNGLVLFMLFAGTYLFQVGLLGELLAAFRPILYAMPVYLITFVAYAGRKGVLLVQDRTDQRELWDDTAFHALSILLKLVALSYYLIVVITVFQLGELRWYTRDAWVRRVRDQSASSSKTRPPHAAAAV